jgi:FlaA1/EpsC-like NDP-sugar epimerase
MTDFISRSIDRLYGYRIAILVLVHASLIVLANQAAFWLRFDGEVPDLQKPYDTSLLPLLLAVRLLCFLPLKLHLGVWRYASIWDLRNILIGVLVSSVVFWAIVHGLLGITRYPRSVFIIDAILLICLLGGVRLARRIYVAQSSSSGARKVVVYGAGDAGELIVRELLQTPSAGMAPVGFIDDDPRKTGQRIHGLPVLGSRDTLDEILKAYRPDELLIAIPSAPRETLRSIVRAVEPHKVRITTLPRLHELIGAKVDVGQIRQLKVEDLLAREVVGLDYRPVRAFLGGKRVAVTGAGGSIGSELCRQIVSAGPASLLLIDRYENGLFQINRELSASRVKPLIEAVVADVTDAERINQVFRAACPQVVFHAAAHKHVPLMELNPCEAVKNNVRGTRLVAEASLACGVERFVLISTDKAVNPTSVMGASKRAAELIVHSLYERHRTKFVTVRFGNVLASNGSVVPTFLEQISKGGPVTVTHPEMKRFFMLIPEAVQLVLHAASLGDSAPLFVLDMGDQVNVADMARDLIRLSGLVPDRDIEIQFTGVRAGEKLFEELVGFDEQAEPSSLDKIMKVSVTSGIGTNQLADAVARLEALAHDGQTDAVLRELHALTRMTLPSQESRTA